MQELSSVNKEFKSILKKREMLTNKMGYDISESWLRCISTGLDPFNDPKQSLISSNELKQIKEKNEDLRKIIIPEIELPGHSIAAIASYPNLSCTGEKINVETDWGVFKDIYCAGEDSVFTFLEGVLSEVVELFPSKYIHIGGDEAPKYRWENCSKCQKRILENKLKDEHELQSYFIQRIEKFLAKKGKLMAVI